MITAEHERAQAGAGDFHDAVLVEFCDGGHDLFGFLRIARRPNESRAEVLGVLCADGRVAARVLEPAATPMPGAWERAEAAGAMLATHEPLERWSASLSNEDGGFEIELQAAAAPFDLDEGPGAELSRAAGVRRYEQLCKVQGTAHAGGRRRDVAGVGRRVRTWGVPAIESLDAARSVFAASGDSGVAVSAVRPAGAGSHDRELVAGHLLGAEGGATALQEVRLSTVYDAKGQPRQAGLELLAPGEEMPHRMAGEAACGISLEAGGRVTSIAFFRWIIDGTPACGSYQLVKRP